MLDWNNEKGEINWSDNMDQGMYRAFLKKSFAEENIDFLDKVQEYRKCFDEKGAVVDSGRAKKLYKEIKANFTDTNAPKEVNVYNSPSRKKVSSSTTPSVDVFDGLAGEVAKVLSDDFIQKTTTYNDFVRKNLLSQELKSTPAPQPTTLELKSTPTPQPTTSESKAGFLSKVGDFLKQATLTVGSLIASGAKAAWKSMTEPTLKSEGQSSKTKENDLWFLGVDLTDKSDKINKQDKKQKSKSEENEIDALLEKTPSAITPSAKLANEHAKEERKASHAPAVSPATPQVDSEKKATFKKK